MHLSQVDFLRHILAECEYLCKESVQNNFDDFVKDERLTKAICRSLEIIGEASNKIHPDLKAKYSHIPWRELSVTSKPNRRHNNDQTDDYKHKMKR